MQFSKVSDIDPARPQSWEDRLFLTFDIDWAADEILNDCIDLVEEAGLCATWFVTHDTPVLSRLRGNTDFELGIHPNFNFLLNGDDRQGADAAEVVDRLLNIVPEAKAVRSHSVTQNSGIMDLFVQRQLTHDLNHFIPAQAGCVLKPWHLWNGLVKVPYFWEDGAVWIFEDKVKLDTLVVQPGVKVFNFHPIHVFLNTEQAKRYEESRHLHQDAKQLIDLRYEGMGTRSYLQKLAKLR